MALRTTGDQVELVAFDVGRISTSVPAQHTYAPADFPGPFLISLQARWEADHERGVTAS
jgi:hypothetical protein